MKTISLLTTLPISTKTIVLESIARKCLLATLCLLAACTQWHYDLGAPLARTDFDETVEASSLAAVLDELGPPQRLSAAGNGFVLAWEHWRINEDTLGIRLGALGADIMSIDWGKARVRGEFLILTFDREHLLTASTYSSWDSKFGGGQAIQPFFSFVSLVDVDDLVEKMPQHRWGASTLQPMPRALNRGSNTDTGQNGIEQRGTPTTIGQHSLEMD